MTDLHYDVFEEGDQWKVRFNGKDFLYPDRKAAIAAAIETAEKVSVLDESVQVFLRGTSGKRQMVWPSGATGAVRTSERRSSERYPTNLEAWITHRSIRTPLACTVKDLSETGVRLMIPRSADLPCEFELRIPSTGAAARIRLVWATGVHYGAQFLSSREPGSTFSLPF
jgi:hypothetical protein